MFKDVDRSMLMKLVALHVVVITVSNALVLSTTPANTGLTTVTTVPNIARK